MDDLDKRISEIKEQIEQLPAGSIGKKTVKGRIYYYHRWNEDGKRREKYIPTAELDGFSALIEQRKKLQQELRSLSALSANAVYAPYSSAASGRIDPGLGVREDETDGSYRVFSRRERFFRTNVLTGSSLRLFTASVEGYKKRGCFSELKEYLYGDHTDRVMILYGLRRTGKTTMIRQAIADMEAEDLDRTAFIQITEKVTLAEVNSDLRNLLENGFRYIFVDEVTLMEDFIQGAALFSDIYAACGMKIVLSGTDSLGFIFAEDEQLYDRCRMIHTTFIPYREFESVLGINGIEEYIRFGGTMSLSGRNYNEDSTFATKRSTDEYVDSSIARNIQHSLRHYQYGGHFRALQELYDKDELTGAVNRVVEDINHRFTLETLTGKFKSHDLGISAANIRRDRNDPSDILDRIDVNEVTMRIAQLLEIKDKEDQQVSIEELHAREIKQYLEHLEIVTDIDVVDMDDLNDMGRRTVVTQPGLRYSQADALVTSLLQDATFSGIPLDKRQDILRRIRSEIKGRMLEEIVLLETSRARPKCDVFTLRFDVGEFDMVVHDQGSLTCEIYEIKHSRERDPAQTRHLVDEEKCRMTEFRYGKISAKIILYRGESCTDNGICYINIEEYLKGL